MSTCLSCTSRIAEIQVIPYPWTERPAAKASDCDAFLYQQNDQVPQTCEDVGDVFVGDTGYTRDCGLERMLREVRTQTCLYGADAAQIVRIADPSDFASTCYEVRARFLRCGPRAELAEGDE